MKPHLRLTMNPGTGLLLFICTVTAAAMLYVVLTSITY